MTRALSMVTGRSELMVRLLEAEGVLDAILDLVAALSSLPF